ncbi:hypothetical protein JCGZ_13168 [Jatropha curcas]|uniref:Uncharacterized protein n=1 Tax=Jatropha curcas TaxID=180498 RepID=A0A067KC68_JATCU|nr:uncharacterized protein LOC105639169 [Jatropha curcas]KDP32618.1 hypothetical protein JCGZ_13168 [Jatropha curcas]
MPNHILGLDTFHIPRFSQSGEKESEDNSTNRAPHISVTHVYEAIVAGFSRHVTVTWNKTLMNYSLTISVENLSNENHYICKIDLKGWQFWGKKGLKSLLVDGKRVEIYWDFRQVKFSRNPEPVSDYYVALVYGEEVVLTLGDLKKDAYKRTKRKPSLEEPILLCKKENVYGKRIFCTKAKLEDDKIEHDIVIEMSYGLDEPELWISIDSFEVIRIMNLHWKFRGNEKVTMRNNFEVEIFWDVHDWLYSSSLSTSSNHGLFIFKPINDSIDRDDTFHDKNNGLRYYDSPREILPTSDYFHVVYAWKFE